MNHRYLLDTHVFLWWREDNERLSAEARERIATASLVFVSLASAWEAAIKIALGRLRLPEPFEQGVRASHFEALPIAFRHTETLVSLPPHHGDPFDRMLIAQARTDDLVLITHDRRFAAYELDLLLT